MVSSISGPRGKQRVILFGLFFVAIFVFIFTTMRESVPTLGSNSCHTTRSLHTTPPPQQVRKHTYLNLNNLNSTKFGKEAREHILVLTTLQNDEQYMDNYFNLLDHSLYPNKLISIGLLISDSTDGTLDEINFHVNRLQNRWSNRFYEIDVFQKDFQFEYRKDDTSLDSKRATMARARNFLLASALKEYHSWVAWIDVKLRSYPTTIFSDLMLADSDVIVPNCLLYREDGSFWGFDRNNWQETDDSLERQQQMPANQVLMEDYNEYSVGRYLLVDMPTHEGADFKVGLDGVGTTFTLVKAGVHREGAIFPPFVYEHEMDGEGFAKMVKAMGYSVHGIPSYTIYHS